MDSKRVKPGTIGVTRIKGPVGWLVWLLQALNGDMSKWTHVFVTINHHEVFEAQPGGAVITPLSEYADRPVAWVDFPLTDEQRLEIAAHAYSYRGVGYNWTTYLYLAAYRLRLPVLTGMLRKRVTNDKRMICSQAADRIYLNCGHHLFTDGRLPADVTPGDFDIFFEE